MENILSREEVSALLVGLAAGHVPAGPPASKRGRVDEIEVYDLVQSPGIAPGSIPAVQSLVRRIRSTFSNAVRRAVAIEAEIAELRFEEFLKTSPAPMSAYPFEIEPLGLKGVVALDLDIISIFIELFMGGSGRRVKRIEGRGFTSLESRLIERVARGILEDLHAVLCELSPVRIRPGDATRPGGLKSVMPKGEPVLCVCLQVDMEVPGGAIHLCLPSSIFESPGEELPRGEGAEGSAARLDADEIVDHLGESAVTLSVELGGRITLQEMMNLRAGDLLSLETSAAFPVEVKVEGVPKLMAFPGRLNGNWAVMVDERITRKDRG